MRKLASERPPGSLPLYGWAWKRAAIRRSDLRRVINVEMFDIDVPERSVAYDPLIRAISA